MSSELEDETLTGTSIDTTDSAYWKAGIDLKGNTTQEVIAGVSGTTVSGTDITINDYDSTKESKFETLDGNTFQQTYEGYNLANLDGSSTTIYGIDITNNDDETITLDGTMNGTVAANLWLTQNTNINNPLANLNDGTWLLKIYPISGSINTTNATAYLIAIGLDSNNNLLQSMIELNLANTTTKTVNLQGCKYSALKIYAFENVTFDNYRFKVVLAKSDDTSLNWEPYCRRNSKPKSIISTRYTSSKR